MSSIGSEQDELVRRLAAVHHLPESVAPPTSPAAEELLDMIMKTSDAEVVPAATVHRRTPWWSRRRLLIGASAVAALAITLGMVVSANGPGAPAPREDSGPASAQDNRQDPPLQLQALEITTEGDYVEIAIIDPVAGPERYSAEIAEHGFDIQLNLAPAYPENVGRVIFMEVGDTGGGPTVDVIEAPGDCAADGECSVVIRVPVGFSTYANIVFGRTPLPADTFEGDAPVLTPEEDQRLAELVGMRISDARAALIEWGWTAEYRVGDESREATADEVPGDWYVTDMTPASRGVVVLWAGPDRS